MLNPAWLGYYWGPDDGVSDVFQEGIHLWMADTNVAKFEYMFESRSNHGYTLAHEQGVVISVTAGAIMIVLESASSSAWEDMFKEHHDQRDTTRQQRLIAIQRIEDGKPVLGYNGRVFMFACSENSGTAEKYAALRKLLGG